METSNIRISKEVHDFLIKKGSYTESMDDILRRLLKLKTKEADGSS